jgi:P pilus assembly chaperone PapD
VVVVVPMGNQATNEEKKQRTNHREFPPKLPHHPKGTTLCDCRLTFRGRIHLIVGHDDDDDD